MVLCVGLNITDTSCLPGPSSTLASWEWSIYSHLAGLLTFGRANKEGADSRRP